MTGSGFLITYFSYTRKQEAMVNPAAKAVVRIIAGAVFAVILARVFFPGAGPAFAAGMFVALVGAAYGLEYIHGRKNR